MRCFQETRTLFRHRPSGPASATCAQPCLLYTLLGIAAPGATSKAAAPVPAHTMVEKDDEENAGEDGEADRAGDEKAAGADDVAEGSPAQIHVSALPWVGKLVGTIATAI